MAREDISNTLKQLELPGGLGAGILGADIALFLMRWRQPCLANAAG